MPVHPPEAQQIAELARLLSAPATTDLPAHRAQELRSHLLTELTAARPDSVAVTGTARWAWIGRRPALLLTAAAAAVTAVALVGGSLTVPDTSPDAAAPVVAVRAGTTEQLAPLMERVANVAQNGPATPIRPEQYVYVRTVGQYAADKYGVSDSGLPWKLPAAHQREIWLPQQADRPGLIREPGKTGSMNFDGVPIGIAHPTHAWLAALPTDPQALLSKIYTETADAAAHAATLGVSKDYVAFEAIGNLVTESIIPPAVNAALYRALARIPGVTVVSDAVDASGRTGVGVAIVRDDLAQRYELIFDQAGARYLGQRSYLVRDTPNGKAGMLTANAAVLARGVADKAGQVPTTN
ncbi:MAG TPA: CU044_5270 family protein [Catenuloplanes sp.]